MSRAVKKTASTLATSQDGLHWLLAYARNLNEDTQEAQVLYHGNGLGSGHTSPSTISQQPATPSEICELSGDVVRDCASYYRSFLLSNPIDVPQTNEHLTLHDVCTGSGQVGIGFANALRTLRRFDVSGTDISHQMLGLANNNYRKHLHSDLRYTLAQRDCQVPTQSVVTQAFLVTVVPPFNGAERVACIATALQSTHPLGHTVVIGNKVVMHDAIRLSATLGLTAQLLCTVRLSDTTTTPQMAVTGRPNNVRLYMVTFTR